MLYNERAEVILQQLKLQSTVKVGELSQLLQVSVDTVRRDLRAMEQAGLVKCLRGGACLPESLSALSNFEGREVIHSDLKRGAARKALGYIKEGDIIGLDNKKILAKGSDIEETTLKLIKALKTDDHEMITLYYGADVTEEDAEALAAKVSEEFPDCEVDFHYGGQPVYYYLVSLE